MPRLYQVHNNVTVGEISEEQISFLCNVLQLEHPDDVDLHINRDTISLVKREGGDEKLVALLLRALDLRTEVDIAWDASEVGTATNGPYR